MGTNNNLNFCFLLLCLNMLAHEGLAQLQIQPLSSLQPLTSGERITLDCKVTNAAGTENIEWYHNDDVVSFGSNLLRDRDGSYTLQVVQDQSTSSTYHWIITILRADVVQDGGTWICRYEGPPPQEVATELLQIGPPTITSVTPDLNNPQPNSDVRLACLASGNPLPSVTWSRTYPVPYILLDGARKGFIREMYNNTIRLNPLTNAHRGEYVCSVTNGFGETLTRRTYVKLPYMPEVTATIKNMRVTENSQAVLACISQAYPATSSGNDVSWTVNGTAIDPLLGYDVFVDRHPDDFYGERYYSSLSIRSTNINHVGTYECTFENTQGLASASINLGLEPTIDPNFGAKSEL